MPLTPPVRLAAWYFGAVLICAGCGRAPATPPAADRRAQNAAAVALAGDQQMPLPLQLPPSVEPLPAAIPDDQGSAACQSIAVQYEQPSTPLATSSARILNLSAAPGAAASGMIREPGARPPSEDREPAPAVTAAPRRSEFVPIEMPKPTPPVATASPPELPSEPTFIPLRSETPAQTSQRQTSSPSSSAQYDAHAAAPAPKHVAPAGPAAPPPAVDPSPMPVVPALPAAPAPPPQGALRSVAQRAEQISDRGFAMAQRGMLYAGRAELIKALQLVAQALDVQDRGTAHTAALASGLAALQEAREFTAADPRPDEVVDVSKIAATHRTPLLKSSASSTALSPVAAQQQYLALSQTQLALAAGNQPVASQALYRLGRLETALAAHDADPSGLHAPQAMAYHQAALAVDASNYLAANELGVLLARYGQLADARRLLIHSVSVHPQVETWHNLAAVHRRLGEEDLARRAQHERDLIARQTGNPTARQATDLVRWVDSQTFAAAAARDTPWPQTAAARSTAASAPSQRR